MPVRHMFHKHEPKVTSYAVLAKSDNRFREKRFFKCLISKKDKASILDVGPP